MNYLKEVVILLSGLYLILLCRRVSGDQRQISSKGVINLAHRRSKWTPLMQMSANLSDITSIRSFFEFRTLDPEGAVFYGDTKEGRDWFVLSLRDGIPEMQIGKADILVSVKGGRKLNDGAWHLLELRSEGKFVVLEVNNKVELVVGLHSKLVEDDLTGKIRLALAGMLVDKQKLFHPFEPEIDACIRGGHWLNLSTTWDTDSTWEPQPCFSEIKKGSYFPGTGVAMFNTSGQTSQTRQECEGAIAPVTTRRLGGHTRPKKDSLEAETLDGPALDTIGHPHRGEGRGSRNVGARKPLQKAALLRQRPALSFDTRRHWGPDDEGNLRTRRLDTGWPVAEPVEDTVMGRAALECMLQDNSIIVMGPTI